MGEDAIKVLILFFARVEKLFMVRLRFRNEWIARVTGLSARHMVDYKKELSDTAIRHFIRRAGADNIDNHIRLRKPDDLAHGWGRSLNGYDVMNIVGVQPGTRSIKSAGSMAATGPGFIELMYPLGSGN